LIPGAGGVETIGVDLGGTKMLIGVLDADASINYRWEGPSPAESAEELLDRMEHELGKAQAACPSVAAVGLGIPCTVDFERGVAVSSVHLPLVDVPVREEMRRRTGLPVFVDNDANLAAVAEHRLGAARGAQNLVMLTIGTGIGGGLILGGRPYRGSSGAAAELGHMVIDLDGPPGRGSCPSRGCLEAVASGTAIGVEGRALAAIWPDSTLGHALAEGRDIDSRLVVQSATDGDAASREVLDLVGHRLGVALAGLANAFDPDVIVLGGGAMAAGDLLLNPATQELRARALPPQNAVAVRVAELGADAGMIGAAVMAQLELGASA